jgi:hypothetical protein
VGRRRSTPDRIQSIKMRIDVTFKRENPEYDQSYAEQYNFGQESDGNWRYDFQEAYSIDDVERFEIRKNTTRVIDRFEIPKVKSLICHRKDGTQVEISISKSLLRKTQKTPSPEKYGIVRFYFYIKTGYDIIRHGDLSFFDAVDVPKDLPLRTEAEEAKDEQNREAGRE